MRVRKFRGVSPAGKLTVLILVFGGNQFDNGLLRPFTTALREKYGAVIRAAEPLP
jgi:hypothetical protein